MTECIDEYKELCYKTKKYKWRSLTKIYEVWYIWKANWKIEKNKKNENYSRYWKICQIPSSIKFFWLKKLLYRWRQKFFLQKHIQQSNIAGICSFRIIKTTFVRNLIWHWTSSSNLLIQYLPADSFVLGFDNWWSLVDDFWSLKNCMIWLVLWSQQILN